MFCDTHYGPKDIPFPSRRCLIPGCNNPAEFGVVVNKVCGLHATPNDYHMRVSRCTRCNTPIENDMVPCASCTQPHDTLVTTLNLEGIRYIKCGREYIFRGKHGNVTLLHNNNNQDDTSYDMKIRSRHAHTFNESNIVIMYNDWKYTSGDDVLGVKRHHVFLNVLNVCMAQPKMNDFYNFRTLKLFYDGYVGTELPLKTLLCTSAIR